LDVVVIYQVSENVIVL